MFSNTPFTAVVNALFQCAALYASSYGISWAMYPIMVMIGYIAFMQSIAASSLFSGLISVEANEYEGNYSLSVLIAFLYLVSSYHVYTLGYTVFAGIMFAHSVIFLLSNVFGIIKLVKD